MEHVIALFFIILIAGGAVAFARAGGVKWRDFFGKETARKKCGGEWK